jgi:hypothetical protein
VPAGMLRWRILPPRPGGARVRGTQLHRGHAGDEAARPGPGSAPRRPVPVVPAAPAVQPLVTQPLAAPPVQTLSAPETPAARPRVTRTAPAARPAAGDQAPAPKSGSG